MEQKPTNKEKVTMVVLALGYLAVNAMQKMFDHILDAVNEEEEQ